MTDEQDARTVDRRGLLRRAGTVAAGIAGTGVAAAAAGPAQAAPGEAVLQGADNNAGPATTILTSASDNATLLLANTATATALDGRVLAAPALQLQPIGDGIHDEAAPGSLSMDRRGTIWATTAQIDDFTVSDYLHSSGNSNTIVPITPQRVIDTRYSASRSRILNRSGNLDSSGRVLGGRTIQISLAHFVFFGDGLFGNLTVTDPVGAGFLTVYPTGNPRPATSTINFGYRQTLSNAYMSGIGWTETVPDVISIYALKTTHVILDVVSFVIGIGAVNPAFLPGATAGLTTESLAAPRAKRALAASRGKPSWK
ncbi:hypothetical protein V6U89_11145 [Micromonospora sp. CPCC 206171]|uniref:hypothetical protein n=1 Tax=Micromonospora sp. CPCC 206171 TaxID=3122405 RepID=UPI002FEFFE41